MTSLANFLKFSCNLAKWLLLYTILCSFGQPRTFGAGGVARSWATGDVLGHNGGRIARQTYAKMRLARVTMHASCRKTSAQIAASRNVHVCGRQVHELFELKVYDIIGLRSNTSFVTFDVKSSPKACLGAVSLLADALPAGEPVRSATGRRVSAVGAGQRARNVVLAESNHGWLKCLSFKNLVRKSIGAWGSSQLA